MELENKQNMLTRILHHNMALVGGFFAGYAVLTRCGFLGNAQTTNLMYLVTALVGNNIREVLIRFLAFFVYCFACFSCVIIRRKTKYDVKLISIAIDAIAMIVMGNISMEVDPTIALLPVFFAMPFQWNAFPGSYGYASSTIFSSNNVRQTVVAMADFVCDRDKKHLHRAIFFGGSILFFSIGVAFSYIGVNYYYEKSIWLCLIALVPALILNSKVNA